MVALCRFTAVANDSHVFCSVYVVGTIRVKVRFTCYTGSLGSNPMSRQFGLMLKMEVHTCYNHKKYCTRYANTQSKQMYP